MVWPMAVIAPNGPAFSAVLNKVTICIYSVKLKPNFRSPLYYVTIINLFGYVDVSGKYAPTSPEVKSQSS